MKGDQQDHRPSHSLKFMSINVGRGGATQDITLARACELYIDVLLIQEPWWSGQTKSHPFYDCHIPFGGIGVRPRAVTYTRRNTTEIMANQSFPSTVPTGDYCWVTVNNITFLNVYKEPHNPSAVQPLLNWTPPPNSVAAGDFNSVHSAWQPDAAHSYGQGEEIECWAEANNLSCLIIGEPTHRAGNTLDLVWTNINGACAWVEREECMTSDHLPICGHIPSITQSPKSDGPLKVPKHKIPEYAKVVSQWVPPLPPLNSIEDIEKATEDICNVLQDALKAIGRRPRRGNGKSAPWWTPDCKAAQLAYQSSINTPERSIQARIYRKIVCTAKREYWKGIVERMETPKEIFKLTRWASPRQPILPPPLLHEDRIISNQAERACVLRDCLLARHDATDDLPPCTEPSEGSIPWSEELSETEVRHCTIGKGNTCPGVDGISVELLSAVWESIGKYVTHLFRACILLGHHPSNFKLAEVVFLPKPGRDPSSIKGWRPISLLSCLGKGLERIIAKRMSYLAITSDIVGQQQFGALTKRSATDLVSCVIHDIEEAQTQGWASTFITLDVQGAYDAVLHNRLIWRMKQQGWSDNILRWTCSFLKDRCVQVRYLGGTTTPRKQVCGVPQGSPVSPILFLLYLAEPMKCGNLRARFGYADDIGILGVGRTVKESATKAQQEVDSLLEWSRNNGVSFDKQKSEMIQFQGRRREDPVSTTVYDRVIEPADHIRWLGIHLDNRLNFKHHVATWSSKALKIAHHLRRLNYVKRGAAPRALVTAVEACVVSVATYGADVWWPGISRPTKKGITTPKTTYLCNLIDKVIHQGLRAALPVWKTTPNVVLHREGGIPPARLLLEGLRLRLAARLNSLDNRHPLRERATVCPNVGTLKYKLKKRVSSRPETQMTRVQRAFRQLPPAEAAEPLLAPSYFGNFGTKTEGIEDFKRWETLVSPLEICAYSDGSSEGHGRSSWGFVLKRAGTTFKRGNGILYGGEIYDAEIYGATMALLAAISARQSGEKIFVLLDNQAAVGALRTGNTSSCLLLTRTFHDVASKTNVEVKWVPGHSKINGNEEADSEARAALHDLPTRETPPGYITLAYLRRLMHQRRQTLIDEWWSTACPARYRDLDLQMRRRKPPELSLPRHLLHQLIAARTGHGDFAAYHRRFHHNEANLECMCGQETSPTHFIRCRLHAQITRRLRKGLTMNEFTNQLLGHNCLKKFIEFARTTACFD